MRIPDQTEVAFRAFPRFETSPSDWRRSLLSPISNSGQILKK